MESMDRDQALSILGLPVSAVPEDVETHYAERRRKLERRWITSRSDSEKRALEAQMRELDAARDAALSGGTSAPPLPAGAALDIKPGAVLADRYVVRARIGFGPRAAVFRALDLTWGKDVALKVMASQLLLVPGTTKRLMEAVSKTYSFAHSGIVNTYSVTVETPGHTFVAMELIEDPSLADQTIKLKSQGLTAARRSAEGILAIVKALCAALSYAHRVTPHYNLTPRNVFMCRGGGVKIGDFLMGQAVPVLAGTLPADMDMSAFIAPEVLALARAETPEAGTIDARADQYSVAALVYYLATGAAPGSGRRLLALERPDLPQPLLAAVERALSLAPEARFATIAEFWHHASAVSRSRWGARIAAGVFGIAVAAAVGVWTAPKFIDQARIDAWLAQLPSLGANTARKPQAEALYERATALRGVLAEAQARLQRRNTDARLTLGTVEQLSRADDVAGPVLPTLADAQRAAQMYQALADLVTPRVFHSPDVLNAYNRIGLSEDHIRGRRYDEAVALLVDAEATLSAKVRDLRQAEMLIEQQFGAAAPFIIDPQAGETTEETAARLRRTWESMTDERRRFADAIDRTLVLVPAGVFAMGDSSGTGPKSEGPIRDVQVAAFKIGRTEVTNAEFAACVADRACAIPPEVTPESLTASETQSLPVTHVSWIEAQAYVDWLRAKTGEDYRLPSEAEWEYAARAQARTAYPWGDDIGFTHAHCLDCGTRGIDGPAPVASYAANAFGLHDVVGNVWEWTADCWYRDYTSAPMDAAPREGGEGCSKRVLRGGSWDNAAWLARLSYRAFAPATTRHELYGFRIAKSVE
ncbi:MAG: SUMF1/EgtB/PvdO family nonheme iron enzyme [Rhodospirillaceae bacterium]|nr:SUMF1/EgtB/PvdO family nonheme iron enzyme [Rhodospirillaceae bacterium]